MGKVGIFYGSFTGDTKRLSRIISAEVMSQARDLSPDLRVDVKNVKEVKAAVLLDYETILIGSSTWDIGQLQHDMVSFHKDMITVNLTGKKVATFGTGDSMYPSFCAAVDILEESLKTCGASIITGGLKVDVDMDAQMDKIRQWVKNVVQA